MRWSSGALFWAAAIETSQRISPFLVEVGWQDLLSRGRDRFAVTLPDEITRRLERRYPIAALADIPDPEMKDLDHDDLDP
jgi:hypothetical protein